MKMTYTSQLFVIDYLRDKVGEWAKGQRATPKKYREQIAQDLHADDKLCMEIFEGVILVCDPGHEKDVLDQLRGVLDHIHILLIQGATSTSDAWKQCYAQTILWRQREAPPADPQNIHSFVLAYLRDKVGEWAYGEWATPRGHQEQMIRELQTDDRLCMEIFEGVILVCQNPIRELDFFYKLRRVLDYIHVLLAEGMVSTSEAWRHMKNEVQSVLWYNYVDALRHQKECSLTEGAPVQPRLQQLSHVPSLSLLTDMRAQLNNI